VPPNFLIIGAQKAATTSLWAYLRSHPEVFLPDYKEPGFFVAEMNWSRGLGWYESLFAGAGDAVARGEASPTYTMYPYFDGVPERIAKVMPDAKLIYVLRDPVERMRSMYVQLLADGTERRPMKDALLYDSRYAVLSSYALQLERYFACFCRSQILLLTSEELHDRRLEVMRRVCGFLGVDPGAPMDLSGESNCSEGKRVPTAVGRLLTPLANAEGHPHVRNQIACHWRHPLLTRAITPEATCMSEQLRRELADVVGPDVERLASWMGPSFSGWGLLARPAVGCQHQVLRAELASASPDAASTAVVEAL
jgi:Sulfotransferase domain